MSPGSKLQTRIQPRLSLSQCQLCTPGERHLEALQDNWLEVEDLGVEVNGTQRARCDDDALEIGKDRLHCQTGIQATELQCKGSVKFMSLYSTLKL